MSTIAFKDVAQKFELLPEKAKRDVYDFIELLLNRVELRKQRKDKKRVLLEMSVWDDKDEKAVSGVRELMSELV